MVLQAGSARGNSVEQGALRTVRCTDQETSCQITSNVIPPTPPLEKQLESPPIGPDPVTQSYLSISAISPWRSQLQPSLSRLTKIPGRLLCTLTDGQRASCQPSPQPKITATWLVEAGEFFFPPVAGTWFRVIFCFGFGSLFCFCHLKSKWRN